MKHRKTTLVGVCVVIILCFGILLTQPLLIRAIQAKYKSTDHFLALKNDSRIRYEESARKNALILAELLTGIESDVESILNSTFEKPAEVYICATQETFNEYVYLSENVRGAVFWGKVFLSPGAFSRGSLADLVRHELTHYLFYSRLGEKAHIKGVPLWFREGLAVFVANGGGSYTDDTSVFSVMAAHERDAYLSGETDLWFRSDDPGDAVGKNGTANWLLYRVAGLFVHFMHDTNPEHFDDLVQRLVTGEEFSIALQGSYNEGVESLLEKFTSYLESHDKVFKAGLVEQAGISTRVDKQDVLTFK